MNQRHLQNPLSPSTPISFDISLKRVNTLVFVRTEVYSTGFFLKFLQVLDIAQFHTQF